MVFFTGSGISSQSGIHTINTLYQDLGMDPNSEIDQFVYDAMHHPEELVSKVLAFYLSAKMSPPTSAHYALANLAKEKNSQVLTGNFDLLHERSGIIPYRVFYRDIETDLTTENLRDVDVILTIGMGKDIRGILEKYKKANPNGRIVAINPEIPRYLGENDLYIQDDAQQIIPDLVENIKRFSSS